MCGIVGYVGKQDVTQVLLNGLKRLEYRGYDSSGMALISGKKLHVHKREGKVNNLATSLKEDLSEEIKKKAVSGIAHTRWATHGAPTTKNAHPHLDFKKKIALVHNGIIENYRTIREHLENQGHSFQSETDSEVLAHLIGDLYKGNLLEATCTALQKIEGTFGIAVICIDKPQEMVVARRGSPIVIGVSKDQTIIASDASAVVSFTQQVIYLEDNDVALVTPDSVDIRNLDNIPVSRSSAELNWDTTAAELGGFEHYMLKEIYEQPDALRNTLRGRLDIENGNTLLSGLNLDSREITAIQRIMIVGCGTSLNAGMVGEYAIEEFANVLAEVEQAAEFRYRNPIILPNDIVLAISQSGETADTLAALREANQKGALVASIVNVVGSTIARETGRGVYLHAGPEISVASTKAFTCQVTVFLMIALKFARNRRLSRQKGIEIATEISRIPELIEAVLEKNDAIARVAEKYAEAEDAFFIGRGYLYPVALEGALKLKEISYIHAEGYHAAELKHGPIALLTEKVPVIALLNDIPGKEKTLSNAHECQARKSPVIGVVTEGDTETAAQVDDVIVVPPAPTYITPIATTVALQLFSYHVARLRGCPIDQPRNLAKSVTVE